MTYYTKINSFICSIRIIAYLILVVTMPAATRADFSADQQKSVSILYSKWFSLPLHHLLTQSKWPSVIAGLYAHSGLSTLHIAPFIKKYALNIEEIEKPLEKFTSFNDFFIRTLKKNARPLAQEQSSISSPADGGILIIEDIGLSNQFPIKGTLLNLEKLLKSRALAEEFQGGTAYIIRLAPWDYHRMHFPLAGVPHAATIIHGTYESVHPFVFTWGIQPLEINERHLILFESDHASTVALIPVGALFVGAIQETYAPEKHVNRGDEIGYFSFGGSTIVMLFKANTITVPPQISQNSASGKETTIKMGESIGNYIDQTSVHSL